MKAVEYFPRNKTELHSVFCLVFKKEDIFDFKFNFRVDIILGASCSFSEIFACAIGVQQTLLPLMSALWSHDLGETQTHAAFAHLQLTCPPLELVEHGDRPPCPELLGRKREAKDFEKV